MRSIPGMPKCHLVQIASCITNPNSQLRHIVTTLIILEIDNYLGNPWVAHAKIPDADNTDPCVVGTAQGAKYLSFHTMQFCMVFNYHTSGWSFLSNKNHLIQSWNSHEVHVQNKILEHKPLSHWIVSRVALLMRWWRWPFSLCESFKGVPME